MEAIQASERENCLLQEDQTREGLRLLTQPLKQFYRYLYRYLILPLLIVTHSKI